MSYCSNVGIIHQQQDTSSIAMSTTNTIELTTQEKLTRALKSLVEFGILKRNLRVLLMTASNFVIYLGMMSPFTYMMSMYEDKYIEMNSAILIFVLHIFIDIPARVIFGFMADYQCLTPVKLNTAAIFFPTLGLFFYEMLKRTVGSQLVFSVLFSVGCGIYK